MIVREDLIGLGEPTPPAMLDYATHVKARRCTTRHRRTRYTLQVWCSSGCWKRAAGHAEQRNIAKAALLYDFIDSLDFYVNPVEGRRSRMNVPFRLKESISRLISWRGQRSTTWWS